MLNNDIDCRIDCVFPGALRQQWITCWIIVDNWPCWPYGVWCQFAKQWPKILTHVFHITIKNFLKTRRKDPSKDTEKRNRWHRHNIDDKSLSPKTVVELLYIGHLTLPLWLIMNKKHINVQTYILSLQKKWERTNHIQAHYEIYSINHAEDFRRWPVLNN